MLLELTVISLHRNILFLLGDHRQELEGVEGGGVRGGEGCIRQLYHGEFNLSHLLVQCEYFGLTNKLNKKGYT